MKKLFLFVVLFVLVCGSIFAQDSDDSSMAFRSFMEKNLAWNPQNIVRWYKTTSFSEDLGVSEYEYNFYSAVADFYSYTHIDSDDTKLFNAKKNLKSVVDADIVDDAYNYKVSSYMFLGAAFMGEGGDAEISARIYEHVYNTLDRYNKDYYSSVYWLLYAGYIDKALYNSLYQVLASAGDDVPVYDYANINSSTKKYMIENLERPSKYKQKQYSSTPTASVDTIIDENIFGMSGIYAENEEVIFKPVIAQEPISTEEVILIGEETGTENPTLINNEEAATVVPVAIIDEEAEQQAMPPVVISEPELYVPQQEEQSQMATVYVDIVSDVNIEHDLEVSIGGQALSFAGSSTSVNAVVAIGQQVVEIKIDNKIYKYSIFVSDEDNIYTIVVGEKNKSTTLYAPSKELTLSIGQASTRSVSDDNSDLSHYAWFENNPYSIDIAMSQTKYIFLRGVAIYNDYIRGINTDDRVLARAKSDFNAVVLANGSDKLEASMYLAFIERIQNKYSSRADAIVARAIMFSSADDYLYPSMLYWRVRFSDTSYDQIAAYERRLAQMPLDTHIFDYTSGTVITLAEALAMRNQSIEASIEANQKLGTRVSILDVPTVNAKINIINMDRNSTKVGLASGLGETKMGFSGKLYEGSNLLEVVDNDTSLSVLIDASIGNNYIFTFLVY